MEKIYYHTYFKCVFILFLIVLVDYACNANVCSNSSDVANEQLPCYKASTKGQTRIIYTSSGAPVYRNENQTINQNIIFNQHFMDLFTRFTHERIPERLVHAKGVGAFGYFQVTNDFTHVCGAKVFSEVGKITKTVCRFSSVFYERGGSDTPRDARGFACRFYTEDGNWDLLSLATEMFSIKDPLKFVPFTRVFKRNPQTNIIIDKNMRWDFVAQNPEAIFVYLNFYGDGGIPDGFRSMPGHAIHPFQCVNDKGDISFVKFSWEPELPKAYLTSKQAEIIQGKDLDYSTRDMYNAIANGIYPAWKLVGTVLSEQEVENAKFDVFDITKIWPKNITKIEIGRLVLNKNPTNFFAEVEQLAFNPINLVPGILGGIDTVFQARRFAYLDTQRHRLGVNYNNIAVNCPLQRHSTYIRDGVAPVLENGWNAPNYFPNSFNGPVFSNLVKPPLYEVYTDPEPNNFEQVSEYYDNLTEGEKQRLIENIVSDLKDVDESVLCKVTQLFMSVNTDLANRVSQSLEQKQ